MIVHPSQAGARGGAGGFTLTEVLVAAVVLALAAGAIFMAASQCFVVLKGARDDSAAALALEYRLEQMRRATWTQITSQEPPPDAYTPPVDLDDEDYVEPDEDAYVSEYMDDLGDADLTPGLVPLLAAVPDSLGALPGSSETIRVVPFPAAGAKAIVVDRMSDGTISTASSSSDYSEVSLEDAVQITAIVRWGSGASARSLAASTIVSRADK